MPNQKQEQKDADKSQKKGFLYYQFIFCYLYMPIGVARDINYSFLDLIRINHQHLLLYY